MINIQILTLHPENNIKIVKNQVDFNKLKSLYRLKNLAKPYSVAIIIAALPP